MGTRELIILILGLAVLAVILRGLMVAIRNRRGQLRMAIDKNIPQDIDLDALELAELPNGGGRVVTRDGGAAPRPVSRPGRKARTLGRAETRAQALDLGGQVAQAGAVPILMDAVAVQARPAMAQDPDPDRATNEGVAHVETMAQPGAIEPRKAPLVPHPSVVASEDDYDDEGFDDDYEDDLEDDLDDEEEYEDDDFEDDEDTFGDEDEDDDEDEEDDFDTFDDEDELDDEDDEEDEDDYDDEEDDLDEDEEEFGDKDGYYDDEDDFEYNQAAASGRQEPTLDPEQSFEASLGEFKMSAGERIGAEPLPAKPVKPVVSPPQASLFDDEAVPAVPQKPERPKPIIPRRQERRPAQPTPPPADFKVAQQAREKRAEPRAVEPSEVLVINVMSRDGQLFHGDDLLQALITTGLKFGDMSIFHYRLNQRSEGPVIFRVANIINPGTFDLNRMGEFSTRGVSLFMAMPTPINNMDAFEQMLKTAQQIRGALNGDLKDDQRNVMTAQTVEHYRQRVRDYELRRLKAAQA